MTWRRVLRWLGVRTTLSILLLLTMLASVVMGLAESSPGIKPISLWGTAAAAVGAGWLLARSPFPGWLAAILGVIIGCEGILLGSGRLGKDLLAVVRSLLQVPLATLRWPWEGSSRAGHAFQELAGVRNRPGESLSSPLDLALSIDR